MQHPQYESRLLLFLDILGFREIVRATEGDPSALDRLLSAIDLIHEMDDDTGHSTKVVSQFSDSIVVSFRVDERSAPFWLLNDVALAIIDIADRGYLTRGAITAGQLVHDNRYLVGPAMVRAYEKESKSAIYPRVLVDPVLPALARKYHAPHHTADHEEGYVKSFMTEDDDGQFFIDYISGERVFDVCGHSVGYDKYLSRLGKMGAEMLRNVDQHVQKKGLWLHHKYVKALDQVLAVPSGSEFYEENTELCESAKDFPKYEDLVEEVQRTLNQSS